MIELYENRFIKFQYDNEKSVFRVIVLEETPTREEFDQLINQFNNFFDACYKNKTYFYFYCDVSKIGYIPLSYIKEIGLFFVSKKEEIEGYLNCSGIILNSVTVRTIINGFFMIYTTIKPVKFIKSHEEAYNFFKTVKPGDRTNMKDYEG